MPGLPRCDPSVKPQSAYDKLPVYVFVCGIEGAGHHAIETVLEQLESYYDLAVTTYNPGLHSFAKHANVSRAYQYPTIDLDRHHQTFVNFLKGPKVHGSKLIFDTRNSYPEGFGVGSLGHPDLAYLSALDGKLFELRVLVLYRHPVASVLSAVRRFKDGNDRPEFQYKNYEYQARSVQESLSMINNGLMTVPCGKSLVLPYEAMLETPLFFAPKLAMLFGVEVDDISKCFGKWKPQPKKSVVGDVAKMKTELTDFFQIQEALWPNIVSYDSHGALSISRNKFERHKSTGQHTVEDAEAEANRAANSEGGGNTAVGSPNDQHKVKAAEKPEKPEKLEPEKPDTSRMAKTKRAMNATSDKRGNNYLKITWYTNLGFNNMRFIMEEALYLAKLLNRKLILAPQLRMRRCLDDEVCETTDCTVRGGNYWCPVTGFLSWSALSSSGAVIIQKENEKKFMKGKTVHEVDGAFDDIWKNTTLYLEKLPPTVKGRLDAAGALADDQPLKFKYHKFQLGCELSYFRTKELTWDSSKAKDSDVRIKGFVDMYGNDDANILYLKGIPHHIGLTPTFWSSKEALQESEAVWKTGIAYHASIVATAKAIAKELVSTGTAKSYMCVHLRRGDFIDAGWLGAAKDLELVKANIVKRQAKGEMIYMATDEQNTTTLSMFRQVGVRTWGDFRESVIQKTKGKHAKMVAFEDYIGLVEQMICARARLFVGSKCSSFTGGILNLRRNIMDDHRYYVTTK